MILSRHRRSGIALVIVMVCIAVLSILAAAFAFSMKVETKLAQNAGSETELTWLGLSGVEYARWVLAQQLTVREEPYDSLNQKWAGGPGSMMTSNNPLADISLDNYPLGRGSFSIKIVDMERKLNINTANMTVLKNAFNLVGVDPAESDPIVSAILDWVDQDDNMHIGGAEDDYYQTLDPPYHCKNKPMDDLAELLLVRGVTQDMYWGGAATNHPPSKFQSRLGSQQPFSAGYVFPVGLREVFTPLSSGQININTASANTLMAIPGIDENTAAEIIRLRSGPDGADATEDDVPFRSPSELQSAGLNPQLFGQISQYLAVRSSTFEVTVDAQINGYHRTFVAVVGRNPRNPRDMPVLTFSWK